MKALAWLLPLWLAGCTLGPDYQRPGEALPVEFRHVEGWKAAEPVEQRLPENWWSLYRDRTLDALLDRLNDHNPSVASALAQYRQASAQLAGSRSALWPQLSGELSAQRSSTAGQGPQDSRTASLGLGWELDLWGRLRRQVEADRASLEASAAELAGVRLSQQTLLVQSYLQLRILDAQQRLLEQTLEAYRRALAIAGNQYRAGLVARSDISQATTQLKNAEAEAIELNYQRAQREHAIAVLLGELPTAFRLTADDSLPALPEIPRQLPSSLLERRPDIAAAERRMIAANAKIGVAEAAYYPDLNLSASAGYRSDQLAQWLSAPNRFWSLGPAFAVNLFDAGKRRAGVAQAQAGYDQAVADYRLSVLSGLQEVEDQLVQLAEQRQQAEVQQQALDAAREALRLVLNQYRAGTEDFTAVVSVQTAALSSERSRLTLLGQRLNASVQLVSALGGGWERVQPVTAASP